MKTETIIYQGAEAKIIKTIYHNKEVIKKHRINKTYRIKEIDQRLISNRTKDEAKLINSARKLGLNVPIIYDIDILNGILTMSYIQGDRVKDIYDKIPHETRRNICRLIGQNIARLHNGNIIHGDITTSNMIYSKERIYFIDFGLGEFNEEIESKGVDLHVLMEAITSTHSQYSNDFEAILEGYEKEYNGNYMDIEKKIEEIILRGRYR